MTDTVLRDVLLAALNRWSVRAWHDRNQLLAESIAKDLADSGWVLRHDHICRDIWHDNIEPVDGLCPKCGAGKWPTKTDHTVNDEWPLVPLSREDVARLETAKRELVADAERRGGYTLDGYYGDPALRDKHERMRHERMRHDYGIALVLGECGYNEPHEPHEYTVAIDDAPANLPCPGLK